MKLGIQISSVKKHLQTPEDVRTSFEKVSTIGYRYIQIQWISPDVSKEFIADALVESDLQCVGTQDYYDEVIPRLDSVIEMNKLWGSHSVCVSGIPERYLSLAGCMDFAKELNTIAEGLREHGMLLVFHPRRQEFVPFDGRPATEILLENTREEVQFGLDLGHVYMAGYEPAAWIHKVAGRMEWVHFKDIEIDSKGTERLTPVGQGVIPWTAAFQACCETGVTYGLAEQERWEKDPFVCLAESFEFLTGLGLDPKGAH